MTPREIDCLTEHERMAEARARLSGGKPWTPPPDLAERARKSR